MHIKIKIKKSIYAQTHKLGEASTQEYTRQVNIFILKQNINTIYIEVRSSELYFTLKHA